MRAAAPAVALLLAALAADGSVQVAAPVLVQPASAVPVTLASGPSGTTSVGASGTSATTSLALLPLNAPATVLGLDSSSGDWSVRLVLDSVSGDIVTDLVTVNLVGSVSQTQVVVRAGADQTSGTPVTLAAAGPDLSVVTFGACLGSCALAMHFEIEPSGGTGPMLRYAYTLTVT